MLYLVPKLPETFAFGVDIRLFRSGILPTPLSTFCSYNSVVSFQLDGQFSL